MEIAIRVSDVLAAEARERGVSVEVYVQELLARSAGRATSEPEIESVRAAIDRLTELRKGNKLGGLRLKDLVHQGHKY
ncbi:MAG TPA: hypothetical protein VNK23_12405 [Candidatus Dormibacteraeota bacterium]|nr:hypothetical protein [Candidatus Dormibacteraeota bacterium]